MRKVMVALSFSVLSFLPAAGADRDFRPLERRTEQLRALRFTRPVPIRVVDGAGMRRVLAEQIRKEYPEGEWPVMEKTLKAFSLIPPKMNLKAVIGGLLEEQVVGLYDPDEKKLFVSDAPMEGSELLSGLAGGNFQIGDVYILHEMVHALTDQCFDLNSLPLKDKENEDRASAARCVVEGDATWVMMRYMYDAMKVPQESRSQLDDVMSGMNMGRELMGTSIPAYLQENLLVAYLAGQALVKSAYERGGFEAVNRLYKNPPQSMEQVLHMEKYFSGSDRPVEIVLLPPKIFAAEGWRKLGSGVWGEFNTRIILQEWGAPEDLARKASEGWGGDAYRVFEGPEGELAFAWATVWDSDRDAAEFAGACAQAKGVVTVKEGKSVMLTKGAPAATVKKAA
jgi:hypothetical protein